MPVMCWVSSTFNSSAVFSFESFKKWILKDGRTVKIVASQSLWWNPWNLQLTVTENCFEIRHLLLLQWDVEKPYMLQNAAVDLFTACPPCSGHTRSSTELWTPAADPASLSRLAALWEHKPMFSKHFLVFLNTSGGLIGEIHLSKC